MASAGWVRWVFAAMFAALSLLYVARLFASDRDASAWGGSADRGVDTSRVVMSLGMVAMLVPWVDPLPRLYWQVLFGVAAGHIGVRLIRRKVQSDPVPRPDLDCHHELHLALGGLAMVYMLVVMPAGHGMANGADRMNMAPMGTSGPALPALTWAFIAYFVVFVVWLGTRLVVPVNTSTTTTAGNGGPRGLVISPHLLGSSEVVMGIGMSYMLMTML